MPHYLINVHPKEETVPVTRIVEAKNQARAIAHVVADTVKVRIATPQDFMTFAKGGGMIETVEEEA